MDMSAIKRAMRAFVVIPAERRWQRREIHALRKQVAEIVATSARELEAYSHAFASDLPLPPMTISMADGDRATQLSMLLVHLSLLADLLVMRDCNEALGEHSPYWNDYIWQTHGEYASEAKYYELLDELNAPAPAPRQRTRSGAARQTQAASVGSTSGTGWPVVGDIQQTEAQEQKPRPAGRGDCEAVQSSQVQPCVIPSAPATDLYGRFTMRPARTDNPASTGESGTTHGTALNDRQLDERPTNPVMQPNTGDEPPAIVAASSPRPPAFRPGLLFIGYCSRSADLWSAIRAVHPHNVRTGRPRSYRAGLGGACFRDAA